MKKALSHKVKRYSVPTERETEAERAQRVAAYMERTRAAFVSTLTLPSVRGVLTGPQKRAKAAAH